MFDEWFELLFKVRDNEFVMWRGKIRSLIDNLGVYLCIEKLLNIFMALGGLWSIVIKVVKFGFFVVLVMLGGNIVDFCNYVKLYCVVV